MSIPKNKKRIRKKISPPVIIIMSIGFVWLFFALLLSVISGKGYAETAFYDNYGEMRDAIIAYEEEHGKYPSEFSELEFGDKELFRIRILESESELFINEDDFLTLHMEYKKKSMTSIFTDSGEEIYRDGEFLHKIDFISSFTNTYNKIISAIEEYKNENGVYPTGFKDFDSEFFYINRTLPVGAVYELFVNEDGFSTFRAHYKKETIMIIYKDSGKEVYRDGTSDVF